MSQADEMDASILSSLWCIERSRLWHGTDKIHFRVNERDTGIKLITWIALRRDISVNVIRTHNFDLVHYKLDLEIVRPLPQLFKFPWTLLLAELIGQIETIIARGNAVDLIAYCLTSKENYVKLNTLFKRNLLLEYLNDSPGMYSMQIKIKIKQD